MSWEMTTSEKKAEKQIYREFKKRFGRKKRKGKKKKNPYNSIRYMVWRTKVLKRDDHTCQHCERKDELTAHHIKYWAECPRLRYTVKNGITLCVDCHDKIHDGLISYFEQQKWLRSLV